MKQQRDSRNRQATEERILAAFLRVAVAQGLDAATTRSVAEAAGVNEVTLFRHFGDKGTLALAAVSHFSPAPAIDARDPAIDASTPERAGEGLLDCLRYLADTLGSRAEILQFGLGESRRYAQLAEAVAAAPRAGYHFLLRALDEARPALRDEVDHEATALQWMGLLVVRQVLTERGVLPRTSIEERDRLLWAAVRPTLRS